MGKKTYQPPPTPVAPPTADDAAAKADKQKQLDTEAAQRRASGLGSTVLTSSQGDTSAQQGKKTTLGGK